MGRSGTILACAEEHRAKRGSRAISTAWDLQTWSALTRQEVIVDLAEWAEATGHEPLTPYRCAFTARLWTLVESIPFVELGETILAERIGTVVGAAERTLQREQRFLPRSRLLEPPGLAILFTAKLRSRSGISAPVIHCLHAEVAGDELFVTIGCAGEFTIHPLAGVQRPTVQPRANPVERTRAVARTASR